MTSLLDVYSIVLFFISSSLGVHHLCYLYFAYLYLFICLLHLVCE